MKIKLNNKFYNVKVCNTFFSKLKGFCFKKEINDILCFPNCNSIHTFFMRCNIDVIMTDKNYKILYIYNNLKINKIILPKKNVYYTFEFKANTTSFKANEYLNIK